MLAAVLMATGCDDSLADEPIGEVKNALTVEEAEAYFEQAMAQEPVTRSAGSKALIPDDFTPEWSKSVSTSYGNVSCLNVPVSSFTGYKARYMQGKERIVNIAQKLVVFKNTDTGEKTQFLLTLLPCYGYVNAHKGEDIAGLFMQGRHEERILGPGVVHLARIGNRVWRVVVCQRTPHRHGHMLKRQGHQATVDRISAACELLPVFCHTCGYGRFRLGLQHGCRSGGWQYAARSNRHTTRRNAIRRERPVQPMAF